MRDPRSSMKYPCRVSKKRDRKEQECPTQFVLTPGESEPVSSSSLRSIERTDLQRSVRTVIPSVTAKKLTMKVIPVSSTGLESMKRARLLEIIHPDQHPSSARDDPMVAAGQRPPIASGKLTKEQLSAASTSRFVVPFQPAGPPPARTKDSQKDSDPSPELGTVVEWLPNAPNSTEKLKSGVTPLPTGVPPRTVLASEVKLAPPSPVRNTPETTFCSSSSIQDSVPVFPQKQLTTDFNAQALGENNCLYRVETEPVSVKSPVKLSTSRSFSNMDVVMDLKPKEEQSFENLQMFAGFFRRMSGFLIRNPATSSSDFISLEEDQVLRLDASTSCEDLVERRDDACQTDLLGILPIEPGWAVHLAVLQCSRGIDSAPVILHMPDSNEESNQRDEVSAAVSGSTLPVDGTISASKIIASAFHQVNVTRLTSLESQLQNEMNIRQHLETQLKDEKKLRRQLERELNQLRNEAVSVRCVNEKSEIEDENLRNVIRDGTHRIGEPHAVQPELNQLRDDVKQSKASTVDHSIEVLNCHTVESGNDHVVAKTVGGKKRTKSRGGVGVESEAEEEEIPPPSLRYLSAVKKFRASNHKTFASEKDKTAGKSIERKRPKSNKFSVKSQIEEWRCDVCNRICGSRPALKSHIRRVHPPNALLLHCEFCKKTSKRMDHLRIHMTSCKKNPKNVSEFDRELSRRTFSVTDPQFDISDDES